MITDLARTENSEPHAPLTAAVDSLSRWLDLSALRHQVRWYRDRADRLGRPLSMIVFTNGRVHDRVDQAFETAIHNHLHEHWFGGRHREHCRLVFLVDTEQPAAEQVARRLVSVMQADGQSVTSTVHTYLTSSDVQENRADSNHEGYPLGDLCYLENPSWKRWMDVIGSTLAIIALLPLFVMVAWFIKTVSRGPVLYTQERVGAKGRLFRIVKFRTMRTSNDTATHREHVAQLAASEDTQLRKIDRHCELTPLARLLRATSIDELPQLLNVLRGEMSLVGPRPDVLPIEAYRHGHLQRFDVLPGMTGLWQVSGKNRTTFAEMMALDIRYVNHRSFWLDMMILLRTLPAIVAQMCSSDSISR